MDRINVSPDSKRRLTQLLSAIRLVDPQADYDTVVKSLLDRWESSEQGVRPVTRGISSKPYSRSRARRGSAASRDTYKDIIKTALKQLGGRGTTKTLRPLIHQLLLDGDHLSEVDQENVPSGEVRWWNHARFARQELVDEGVLRSDSPKGTWELEGTPTATLPALRTGAEAGLSGDQQILICLHHMAEAHGPVPVHEFYPIIEERMAPHKLSEQGRSSIRFFINTRAVDAGFVHPGSRGQKGWRITEAGLMHAKANPI